MQEYILELSKYFITICIVLYTLTCFYAFRHPLRTGRRGIYILQNVIMFFIQSACFAQLCIDSQDAQYLFFYVFVQIFLLTAIALVGLIYEKINKLLLNNMCMLLGIGLCILARLNFERAIKQYIIVMLSLIVSLVIPFLMNQIHFLKKMTWIYGAFGITLLSVVLILGEVTHGSKISFSVGGISFQPSEFVKIIFVFFLAAALWEDISIQRVFLTSVLSGIQVIVLVLSRDLGSALIFFVGFVMIVFVATKSYLYLLLGIIGGSAAACVAYGLFDHVKTRVLAWQDPWSYIDNEGYQITQSLFAVGSGSWFGMGLMGGNPTAIPYVDVDLIFSSVCEEMGAIFGVCVILICLCSFFMMIVISLKIFDRFYQLIVYGLAVMYIFQIFLTVGGGIKFIPLTGVTLPFISYGGSSIMSSMFMFFIIQGIHVRLQQEGGKRVVRKKKVSAEEYKYADSSDTEQ